MKKIFSKKSGFTLVEIVVAFAVFAIFAAMITQVINLSIDRKKSNLEFEKNVEREQENLILTKLDDSGFDDGTAADDQLHLSFDGGTMDIDYQMKDVNGNVGNAGGINYFVGNLNKNPSGPAGTNTPTPPVSTPDSDPDESVRDPGAEVATLLGKLQVGITGTKSMAYVEISVSKKSDTEYEITARADDSTVPQTSIKQYANFSLYFPDEFQIHTVKATSYNNGIAITKSANGVKVSVINEWTSLQSGATFKVTLKNPPDGGKLLSAQSFGENHYNDNGQAEWGYTSAKYKCYETTLNGTKYIFDNVYGATLK